MSRVAPNNPRARARLARALAAFWQGGAGPTHGDIQDVFDVVGVAPDGANKRDRVSSAVKMAADEDLSELVHQLVELLWRCGSFRRGEFCAAEPVLVDHLVEAVRAFDMELLPDGTLRRASGLASSDSKLNDVPALREHIRRIELALAADDDSLLIGTSKELLESVCKVVLDAEGARIPPKFPALVAQTTELLAIHPKSDPSSRSELAESVRKILGGLLQVAQGVNELRNERGTGHGRAAAPVRLGRRQARLAAASSVVVATFILDTYEDPRAPWRSGRGESREGADDAS